MADKVVEVLKQAILNEIEGYEFYRMYAEKVSSKEVKDTFLKIADEELLHVKFLKSMMSDKQKEEMALEEIEVPSPEIFKFSSLTPDEISLALSAFSIAVKMEDDAAVFYKEEAEKIDDKKLEKLFLTLSQWEGIHRDTFKKEYDLLKQEWWSENEFAPF